MRYTKQDYLDTVIDNVYNLPCDCVQLKYDGWWTRNVLQHGYWSIFTSSGRLLRRTQSVDPSVEAVIIGEFMYGTQWAKDPAREGTLYVFDCWEYFDQGLETFAYKKRNLVASKVVAALKQPEFKMVDTYPITQAIPTWNTMVVTEEFEGLVFRHSNNMIDDKLYRAKLKITVEGTCVGFKPGEGKYTNALGSIEVLSDGSKITVDVGGGFEDVDRIEIWENREKYLGQRLEFEARKKFESGSYRHPNFIRWKP